MWSIKKQEKDFAQDSDWNPAHHERQSWIMILLPKGGNVRQLLVMNISSALRSSLWTHLPPDLISFFPFIGDSFVEHYKIAQKKKREGNDCSRKRHFILSTLQLQEKVDNRAWTFASVARRWLLAEHLAPICCCPLTREAIVPSSPRSLILDFIQSEELTERSWCDADP